MDRDALFEDLNSSDRDDLPLGAFTFQLVLLDSYELLIFNGGESKLSHDKIFNSYTVTFICHTRGCNTKSLKQQNRLLLSSQCNDKLMCAKR